MKIIMGPPDPQGKGVHDSTFKVGETEVLVTRAERRDYEQDHPRSRAKRWYALAGNKLLCSSTSLNGAIRNAKTVLNILKAAP